MSNITKIKTKELTLPNTLEEILSPWFKRPCGLGMILTSSIYVRAIFGHFVCKHLLFPFALYVILCQ